MRVSDQRRGVALRIAAIFVSVAGVAGAQSASAATPNPDKNKLAAAKGNVSAMTWNVSPQPTTLDSNGFTISAVTISSLLCDRLIVATPSLGVQPYLATNLVYANPTTLVLTIKQGVKYWDGTPLTTADVVWNLQRMKDNVNGIASTSVQRYANVVSITQTARDKVTIRLKQHMNTFELVLMGSQSEIQKPAYVQQQGTANGTPSGGLMCSGPYELKSWKPGDSLVMTRNPDYWNKAFTPHVDTITFKFISASNAIAAALKSGEIDGMYNPPSDILEQLEGSGAGKLYGGRSQSYDALNVTNLTGPLADARIRQALALVIDRQAIARTIYHGFSRPNTLAISSPVAFGAEVGIYRKQLKSLNYLLKPDVARAKALIAQAGGPPSSPITLYFQAGVGSYLQDATTIQQEAKAIGLDLQLVPKDGTTLNAIMFNPDSSARKGVDLWLRTNLQNVPRDPLTLIISGYTPGLLLDFGYRNPIWLNSIAAAIVTTSPAKEAALIAKALLVATNDFMGIPIVYNTSTLYLNKRLTGAWLNDAYYGPWATAIGAP